MKKSNAARSAVRGLPVHLAATTLLAAAALVGCGGGGVVPDPSALNTNYNTLVWQDDFNGATLDTSKWAGLTGDGTEYGNPGWGNNELQYFLPSSATVSGSGNLQIRGKWDSSTGNAWSGRLTAARLTSLSGVDMGQPGFLEVRADLPCSAGSWPAIWLLPGTSPGVTFPPAASGNPRWPLGGEIDMVEWFGRYFAGQTSLAQSTLHQPLPGTPTAADTYQFNKVTLASPICGNFHLYQLAWTADQIQFAIDGKIVTTCTKSNRACTPRASDSAGPNPAVDWPFDSQRTYYLIMNLAVGGALGAPNGDNRQVPLNYDQTMLVDYVRYKRP